MTCLWMVMTLISRMGERACRKLTDSPPPFQPLDQTSLGRAADQQEGSDLSHHKHIDTNSYAHIASKHVHKYINLISINKKFS